MTAVIGRRAGLIVSAIADPVRGVDAGSAPRSWTSTRSAFFARARQPSPRRSSPRPALGARSCSARWAVLTPSRSTPRRTSLSAGCREPQELADFCRWSVTWCGHAVLG